MKPNLFKYLFTQFLVYADEGGGGTVVAEGAEVSAPAAIDAIETPAAEMPVTDQRTYMDQDGKFTNPAWAGEGNENIAAKFTSLEALTKSYVHLERQLGNSNKIAIPNENSPEEDWNAYYNANGRPEAPEGYELAKPEAVADEHWNADEAAEYTKFAHSIGLSKAHAQKLAAWQAERVGSGVEANLAEQTKMRDEGIAGLKEEWGSDFDANLADAKRGAMASGGQELVDHPLAANDPVVIRALAKMGAMIKEDSSAAIRDPSSSLTSGSLDEQIAAIRNDAAHPFHHAGHPAHNKAVMHMDSLYQRRNPEKA